MVFSCGLTFPLIGPTTINFPQVILSVCGFLSLTVTMFSFRVISMIISIRGLFLALYKIYSTTFTIWMKIWSSTLRLVSFQFLFFFNSKFILSTQRTQITVTYITYVSDNTTLELLTIRYTAYHTILTYGANNTTQLSIIIDY